MRPTQALARLEGVAALSLRDALRTARGAALANAESVGPLYVSIDQLGKYLDPKGTGLGSHRGHLVELAKRSPLYMLDPVFHVRFETLFDVVLSARNDAMHQGVYARHLAHYAVELAIVLEDALMSERSTVSDYMIRTPVIGEMWQPLSFVRQNMIENSFTYLPIQKEDEWFLIDDQSVATALRGASEAVSNSERSRRLAMSVQEALTSGLIRLVKPGWCATPDESISSVLARELSGRMVLVLESVRPASQDAPLEKRLVGILMPFDLL